MPELRAGVRIERDVGIAISAGTGWLGRVAEPVAHVDHVAHRRDRRAIADYARKGGLLADTEGRQCLCNGLTATVGLGQLRADGPEPFLVTSGDHLQELGPLVSSWRDVRADRYLMG
jgi:hypothetical protein